MMCDTGIADQHPVAMVTIYSASSAALHWRLTAASLHVAQ